MNILINLLVSGAMAWLAYNIIEKLNEEDEKLQLNPVVHAAITFLFGITGMCISAGYVAVKSYKVNKKDE